MNRELLVVVVVVVVKIEPTEKLHSTARDESANSVALPHC
jgi:hypothetical protein